ncbi:MULTISPECIES: 1,6-anhydro-N-acetylmuramyl-L-alanine amidase AmpD [Pseudomonas]|uniref:1,6-anhydro-N-acetylmuramyl-L-alanine amidase AmpD n=1 Tax=Pseudomonas quercus TaxID=2722792 RepID=A0ABX0YDJ4_9PSED|nr:MULTISPECIES: 1,6-anhydro-N-acetylmuramyl-L-alanine amidase AmpD [Pseudomonas]MBF7142891.1 1,6-anhydro-N-acetylmuramyl-L-alanine amidase AmpD [Pseudomonas sp. LY10J]NJP01439.1 1,6-anhydro-N-acetylmuramyl-L-alanine amidase AmpD [Pseudomonas quercus]
MHLDEVRLDPVSGWCHGVRHCPSPNFNTRPGDDVSLLVIHNISLPPGEFGTGKVVEFFQNRLDPAEHPYFQSISSLTVSAHFMIEREGDIIQFVSCRDRAWHAGVSTFEGRAGCNDFSIGIELEGTDDLPYTEAQYRSLARLAEQLQSLYPAIAPSTVQGHCHIAPGRKTDPGPAFDWDRFRSTLAPGKEGNA